MNNFQLSGFNSMLENALSCHNKDLCALIQVCTAEEAKQIIGLVSNRYKVKHRDAQYVITRGENSCLVSVVRMIKDDDWLSICARSFNFVAFTQVSEVLKSRILSRLRLCPYAAYVYADNYLEEFKL